MAVFTSHRPCAHAGTESGRSPNPLFAEEWQVVGRGLAPAERMLFINQKRTTDGRPCKMNDRFMKTKRREQAPALRYEIDLSAKDAEKNARGTPALIFLNILDTKQTAVII